jgi:hypothetical protein
LLWWITYTSIASHRTRDIISLLGFRNNKEEEYNSDRNRIVRSILYVPICNEVIQNQREMYWKRAFLIHFQHLKVSMKYELEEPFFEEKGKITSQTEFGGTTDHRQLIQPKEQ